MEIMRHAFYEYIQQCDTSIDSHHLKYLNDLGLFLLDMRNALLHTRDALVAKGPEKQKDVRTKKKFSINIPIRQIGENWIFDPRSKNGKALSWSAIKAGKEVKTTKRFLNKIIVLSYHVLEITKRQKASTLVEYLTFVERVCVKRNENQ
jgi:hypothetical protein